MVPSDSSAAIQRLLALGGELASPPPGMPRRKFELDHMRTLLLALGNPESRFPAVLIAGTNGKGSTAATLASILGAAGHRVGLYTSPHLERLNERIRIGGELIEDDALAQAFVLVEQASARLVTSGELPYLPSFFEAVTAVAFLHFAGRSGENGPPVEIAVLEVGLGGRLDATNVVEPWVSILTDISMDHAEWLGSTIAQISGEKAGILRARGTMVTLPQHPEANQRIGEIAVPLEVEAINAADYLPLRAGGAEREKPLPDMLRNRYQLGLPANVLGGVTLTIDSPLGGAHQQRNIALAIAAAVALQRRGLTLTAEAVERGVRETAWPGRLQLLLPPADQPHHAPIVLDAAHNPAGAWALRAALSPLPVTGRRTLVFGCMADKAVGELAQILFPVFDEVILTQASSPRAASVEVLGRAAEPTGALYRTYRDPSAALEAAKDGTPQGGLVVLAGSIALLGEFRGQLRGWV